MHHADLAVAVYRVATLLPCLLYAWIQAPVCAQEAPPSVPATEVTVDRLRELATTWLDCKRRHAAAEGGAARTATAEAYATAKQAFAVAAGAFEAQRATQLLLDADTLRDVFRDACRPHETTPGTGTIGFRTQEGRTTAEFVPPGYDLGNRHRTVLLLPDAAARASRDTLQSLLELTWREAAAREGTLVLAPGLPADLDFDAPGERPLSAEAEQQRIGEALRPLGEAMRALHVDRDRIVLDCGKGTSAFGMRLVACFPDRFAGLVLRWPIVENRTRLDAIPGMPVLLLRCAATQTACTELAARLNALAPGSCFTRAPTSDYPFADEPGIAEWARQCLRRPMPERCVVAPVDDRFRRNAWAEIQVAEPLDPTALDRGPLLVATADRAKNRIEVTTRAVRSFRLLLGPALVDAREFTLVVDGSSQQVRLQPSLAFLVDQIFIRNDPGWLYTAQHRVQVR